MRELIKRNSIMLPSLETDDRYYTYIGTISEGGVTHKLTIAEKLGASDILRSRPESVFLVESSQ